MVATEGFGDTVFYESVDGGVHVVHEFADSAAAESAAERLPADEWEFNQAAYEAEIALGLSEKLADVRESIKHLQDSDFAAQTVEISTQDYQRDEFDEIATRHMAMLWDA